MKFSLGLASTLSILVASVAAKNSTPSKSACSAAKESIGTYNGHVKDKVCAFLVDDCIDEVAKTSKIWSIPSCVAGATCTGTRNMIQLAKCANPSLHSVAPSDLTSLDYNLYSEIVGDCAWKSGGCPITHQNYIDFFYGTLDDLCSDIWPDVNDVVNDYWAPIVEWTKKSPNVPYVNFNDWLHWSDSH